MAVTKSSMKLLGLMVVALSARIALSEPVRLCLGFDDPEREAELWPAVVGGDDAFCLRSKR